MDVQKLKEDIERLGRLIAGWPAEGPVAGIERGVALEKLRALYENILSGGTPAEAVVTPAPTQPAAVPVPAATIAPPAEKPFEPASDTPELSIIAEEGPSAVTASAADTNPVREETAAAPAEPADQKLFNDEQIVRPRMDKQVILSLYGDAPVVQSPSVPSRPSANPVAEPVPSVARTAPVADSYAADGGGSKKVLGEVIGNGGGSAMNEVLGKQSAHSDVASRLQSRSISGDLHHSIGINDRFMLIRSLFDGDGEAYSVMIARLNQFDDLDEALLHIQETYSWNPDSEAVQLLVDLLERKLG